MKIFMVIGIGGFFGSISRHILSQLTDKLVGNPSPIGTLLVNVIGSFIIGAVMYLSMRNLVLSPAWRFAIGTGFLGAFTTFSTFSYETFQLIESGQYPYALGNILLNVGISLTATFVGWYCLRTLIHA